MQRNMKKVLQGLLALMITFNVLSVCTTVVKAASNPYPTTQDVDGDGNYEVPCTRFAWQQAFDNTGIALPAWGNAASWYNAAANAGIAGVTVGSVPRAKSIAVWTGDTYGHVAYVTSVSGANTFTVNEGGRTDLDHTSSHGVKYGYTLTNAVGQRRPYDPGKTLIGFIYLDAPTTPTVPVPDATWIQPEAIVDHDNCNATISWPQVAYADYYNVVIRDNIGDIIASASNLKSLSYRAEMPHRGTFYAYITAHNSSGYTTSKGMFFYVIDIAPESITLGAEVKEKELNVGQTLQLYTYLNPTYAYQNEVEWTSSSSSVASVDKKGKITALQSGEATITAKTNGKIASCIVHVQDAAPKLEKTVKNIKAKSVGTTSVQLTWDATDDVDGYLIYRKNSKENYSYRGMVKGNITTYTDISAQTGEYNYYWVFPYKNIDGQMVVGEVDGYVYVTPIPSPTKNEKAVVSGPNVKLTWDAVEDVDGYIIYRQVGSDGEFQYRYIVKGTSFVDNTAKANEFNFYRVYPYKEINGKQIVGVSQKYVYAKPSGIAELKTSDEPQHSLINEPKAVEVSSKQIQIPDTTWVMPEVIVDHDSYNITVSWPQVAYADYYNVVIRDNIGITIASENVLNGGITFTAKMPHRGTYYAYITAHNSSGFTTSMARYFYINDVTPESISLGAKVNKVELNVGETIQLFTYFNPSYAYHSEIKWSSSSPSVVSVDENGKITALQSGDALIKTKIIGMGAVCMVHVKDPSPKLKQTVKNIKAKSVGTTSVQLTWDATDDVDGYLIYRKNSKENYSYRGMVKGNITTYTDISAQTGEYNYYWVFPYKNIDGQMVVGEVDGYVYVTPIPSPTKNEKAVVSGPNVKLTWDAVEDVDGYIIYRQVGSDGEFQYRYIVKGTSFVDTTAKANEFNFYRVYPYKEINGKQIVGVSQKYVYAKPSGIK